jgi:hypothetical protein
MNSVPPAYLPAEIGPNRCVIHAMPSKYFIHIKKSFQSKEDSQLFNNWPWIGAYPRLWTCWKPFVDDLKTIDGSSEEFVDGKGDLRVILRLELKVTAKIAVLDDYDNDYSQDVKNKLAIQKKHNITIPPKTQYQHNKTETIYLLTEAGYDALYIPEFDELVILNAKIIKNITQCKNGQRSVEL